MFTSETAELMRLVTKWKLIMILQCYKIITVKENNIVSKK
jgi:hypothetical protein